MQMLMLRSPRPRVLRLALFAVLAAAAPLGAQQSGKRPVAIADFDQWRSIRGETLSPDGRWAAYSLVPQVGEGELVVRRTDGSTEHRHDRGYIGRPQTRAGAARGAGYSAPAPRFTADSRHLLFTIEPPRSEVEAAMKAKKKDDDQPKTSLGVLDLATGRVEVIARVKSYDLADESGRYVAYLLEQEPVGAEAEKPEADSASAKGKKKKKDPGTTLVLRELASGTETPTDEVLAFRFDERGRWLAYTVSSADSARDGVYIRSLEDGATHPVLTGRGNYRQLVLDEAGTQLAFVTDRDDYAAVEPRFALYRAELKPRAAARRLVGADGAGAGLVVSDGGVAFTEDGKALRFGLAPEPADTLPSDPLGERAVFDLWHWKDARLQPQQRLQADRDRNRSWATVYHLDEGRFVRLGSDSMDVELSDDGRVALGRNGLPYAVSSMWGEGGEDVYLIDARTGERKRIAERVEFGARLSPDARYAYWFDQGRWWTYDVERARRVDLTGGVEGVRFDRETWDTPSTPYPWGVAGWTEDDRSVLVYDRYDVWELDPAGRRAPRRVTDALGRRTATVLRLVDLDPEEESIDASEPLLLDAFNEATKQSGFFRDRLGASAEPTRLVLDDVRYGRPEKAKDADVLVFTRTTVEDYDLRASGPDFSDQVRLSDANPQQSEYRWATVELVRWRSDGGVELQGLLYKPENFDASKKYPMVVYFYEQLSDNLHQYHQPSGRNVINPLVYASNGYLVFEPDIHYTDGYPGPSAMKSIVPGVQALIARGFVDPDAVGLQGQSWGGYQTAYIITQTRMFRAAMAGAPVANMTSAYGGIRWGTGLNRAFQYEKTQSRIGGSLWEYPERYIENSPLFFADRVETPLFIMHNDEDGAVPWYQGIEMFIALRRLGKEVYMINYNGDEHNPTKRANQLDMALRMQQFFDHHLKGEPMPAWMRDGIPFLDKGRDQLKKPAPRVTAEAAAVGGDAP